MFHFWFVFIDLCSDVKLDFNSLKNVIPKMLTLKMYSMLLLKVNREWKSHNYFD